MTKNILVPSICLLSLTALSGCYQGHNSSMNTGFDTSYQRTTGSGYQASTGNVFNGVYQPLAYDILNNLLVRERSINDGIYRYEQDESRYRMYLSNNRLSRQERRLAEEKMRLANAQLAEQRRHL